MNYEISKSRDLDIHDLAIPKQDVVKVDIVSDIQPPTKEVIPLHEVAPHLDNSHMIEKKTPTSFSDVEIFIVSS